MTLNSQIINLNKKITNCKKCTRLVFFRRKVAKEKIKQLIWIFKSSYNKRVHINLLEHDNIN